MTHWGDRVRQLREARGLSMDELGALCVPRTEGTTISKLEKGRLKMTEAWVRRLAAALGVPTIDITEPLAKLQPRESAMIAMARALDEDQWDVLWRVADALPKSAPDGDGGEPAAPAPRPRRHRR